MYNPENQIYPIISSGMKEFIHGRIEQRGLINKSHMSTFRENNQPGPWNLLMHLL
jgi:hypothetical protein